MLLPIQTHLHRLRASENTTHVRRSTISPSAIGAFIGGTAGVLLLCGLVFLILHRRHKAQQIREILASARARVLAQADNPQFLRSHSAGYPNPTFTPASLPRPTTVSFAARTRLAALTTDPYANRPSQRLQPPTLPSLTEPSNMTETSEFDIERRPSPINADHAEWRARKAAELKAQGYSDTDIILASDFSDGVDPYNTRWDAAWGEGGVVDPYALREGMGMQTQTQTQTQTQSSGQMQMHPLQQRQQQQSRHEQPHAKPAVVTTQHPQPPSKGLAARVSHILLPSTVYTPPKPTATTAQPNAQDHHPTTSTSTPHIQHDALNPEDTATPPAERGRSTNRQRGTPGRTPPPSTTAGRRKLGT